MTVALCWGDLGRGTHNRARPWRHDDRSVRMTLGNRLADPVLIVIAVGGEGSNGIDDLVEQRVNRRAIVDFFLGHFDGDDLAADGIDADMQLPPGPAAGRTVLFNQPFAAAAELQASAVDQQMKRAGSCPLERRQFQRLRPAAERGMVWHREVKAKQSDDGADSPSVCRSARPNTKPIVRAVLIASAE